MSHFGSRLARHPLRRQLADDRWQPDLRPCTLRNLCLRQDGCHGQAECLLEERDGRDVLLVRQPRHHRREHLCRQPARGAGGDRRLRAAPSSRTSFSAILRRSRAVSAAASRPRPARLRNRYWRKNLFWNNDVNLFRANPRPQGQPDAGRTVPLDGETASVMLDPGLLQGESAISRWRPIRRRGARGSAWPSPWSLPVLGRSE